MGGSFIQIILITSAAGGIESEDPAYKVRGNQILLSALRSLKTEGLTVTPVAFVLRASIEVPGKKNLCSSRILISSTLNSAPLTWYGVLSTLSNPIEPGECLSGEHGVIKIFFSILSPWLLFKPMKKRHSHVLSFSELLIFKLGTF